METELRRGIARGGLVFGAATPLAYVVQRLFERARGGPGDPLGVVRELHTAFYWRASVAVWLGVIAAILVVRSRAQLPERGVMAVAVAMALGLVGVALGFP